MAFLGQVALVHGARNTHWVSATIDPNDPNLFVFEPQIVAANAG